MPQRDYDDENNVWRARVSVTAKRTLRRIAKLSAEAIKDMTDERVRDMCLEHIMDSNWTWHDGRKDADVMAEEAAILVKESGDFAAMIAAAEMRDIESEGW